MQEKWRHKRLQTSKNNSKEINFAEVHDCFSIAEIYERSTRTSKTRRSRKTIQRKTNLLWCKNTNKHIRRTKSVRTPSRSNRVKQAIEATMQLRRSKRKTSKNATIGVTHNVGSGATAVIHVFKEWSDFYKKFYKIFIKGRMVWE